MPQTRYIKFTTALIIKGKKAKIARVKKRSKTYKIDANIVQFAAPFCIGHGHNAQNFPIVTTVAKVGSWHPQHNNNKHEIDAYSVAQHPQQNIWRLPDEGNGWDWLDCGQQVRSLIRSAHWGHYWCLLFGSSLNWMPAQSYWKGVLLQWQYSCCNHGVIHLLCWRWQGEIML